MCVDSHRRISHARAAAVATAAAWAILGAVATPVWAAGALSDARFTGYSIYSSNAELARRMLSPLTAAQLPRLLARSGKQLRDQPIDLSGEKFVVYVPANEPPPGYALLVFVPPWNEAKLPDGWASVLDQYGVIFVSAARSGNDQSPLGRREPLALLAEQNIAARFRLDPQRVFIAGFSGGSRVALRLALAYPDIFDGAILNAGSDPIGDATTPLPPRDLFVRFQQSTHLVYVTGDGDTFHLAADLASLRSLRAWCVFGVEDHTAPFAEHEVASAAALSRALAALFNPHAPDADQLAGCKSRIDTELADKLQHVRALVAGGKRESARQLLQDIDARFGGLAAPPSTDLSRELDGLSGR